VPADAALVHHIESLLAGAIGSASARVMVSSVVEEEPLGVDEVLDENGRVGIREPERANPLRGLRRHG
jgi:hypothetical protein